MILARNLAAASFAENVRCDHPGCHSRVTRMYLVGLGGIWVTRYFTDGVLFLKWRTCRVCKHIDREGAA